ncbi:MAG: uroporphyrinogen-III synthase [Caulobacteraceae bacterium]|nr:uroporphyrinogen-III synthase [Caulobacteraceae bacterium]
MRVWVTRASPGAERTAEHLRLLGHSPLLSPVMRVRQVPATIDLTDAAALAFTSANGVEAFALRSPGRDLPVFAVGDATAQAAREAGFGDVTSASGDVEALGRLIASAGLPDGAVIVHPGGRELAGDLGAASGPGVRIRPVALYETVARAPSEALSAMDADGIDAVLVHSSKAARRVAAVCAPWREGRAWYLALSPAVAAPLLEAGFEKVRVAPAPDEAALLRLLTERVNGSPPSPASVQPYAPPAPVRRGPAAPPIWGLALAAVAAVAAAIGIAVYAPRPGKPEARQEGAPAAGPSEAALKARIRALEAELTRARALAPPEASAAGGQDLSALEVRLARLEANQGKAARAAAAAVAAAALADAASTSRPFVNELATLERLSPGAKDLAGLRPLAETGAPTVAALAAEFPEVADRAAAASRGVGDETSLLGRIGRALASLFTLRRVGDLAGESPDAVLARAERRVADGDIEGALQQLRALPPGGRLATADWSERAERRVELGRRIAALRAQALRDLAEAEAAR